MIVSGGACRSPQDYRENADETAYDIIEEKQKATGKVETFTIERPMDTFRRRLMAGQNLPRAAALSLGVDQLEELVGQIGLSDATQLPGDALPHKIREALWVARRANALPYVHDWLKTLTPEEQLRRPRIRQRRSRVRRTPGVRSTRSTHRRYRR